MSTSIRRMMVASLSAALLASGAFAGTTLHVDPAAPAGGDGASWDSPLRFLQDALAVASAAGATEIRVAQGVQNPDQNAASPSGTGNKNVAFTLKDGVTIRGGYAGIAGDDPDAHDPVAFPTILSGDLLGNDTAVPSTLNDNSVAVVVAGSASGAVVEDLQIVAAKGAASGGGVRVESSAASVTLRRCVVRNNTATSGAGLFCKDGDLVLERCRLEGNTATGSGGALLVGLNGSVELRTCLVNGNVAADGGAGVAFGSGNTDTRRLLAINCTVHANRCTNAGLQGGFRGDRVLCRSTILWNNRRGTTTFDELAQVDPDCRVEFCTIMGVAQAGPEPANSAADPLFADADGADTMLGTADDDLTLLAGSPAIDAAHPDEPVAAGDLDLAGGPRRLACRVDRGALESAAAGPDCDGNGQSDACDIATGLHTDCDRDGTPDACAVAQGTLNDCDGEGAPDFCALTAPFVATSGPLAITSGGFPVKVSYAAPPAATAVKIVALVKGNATALAGLLKLNGSELLGAPLFADTAQCPDLPLQSWTFVPATEFNALTPLGIATVEMSASVVAGTPTCGGPATVELRVEYAGATDAADCDGNGVPDDCDLASGTSPDGNGDGIPDQCQGVPLATLNVPSPAYPNIQAAVSAAADHYEIVLADGVYGGAGNRDVDLQGKRLTIRSANGPEACVIDLAYVGRAFLIDSGEPEGTLIQGITVRRGAATGGLARVVGAFATFDNVVAKECRATALDLGTGAQVLCRGCVFSGNWTNQSFTGSAIATQSATLLALEECDFIANITTAGDSGPVRCFGTTTMDRCRFVGNGTGPGIGTGGDAGAVLAGGPLTMRDCLVWRNKAGSDSGVAGAVWVGGVSVLLERCTLAHNSGYGTFNDTGGVRVAALGSATLRDCILWGNSGGNLTTGTMQSAQLAAVPNGTFTLERCTIHGWLGTLAGTACNGFVPGFADIDGADGIVGTIDDDLRPLPGSAVIDAGDPAFMGSPAARGRPVDASGEPRVVGCRVDRGALESAAPRDCDGDGLADACGPAAAAADCDGDGVPDVCAIDCDGDQVPEACVVPPTSSTFAPPAQGGTTVAGVSRTFTLTQLPYATAPVRIDVTAKLSYAFTQGSAVLLADGELVGELFLVFKPACSFAKSEPVWMPAAQFNALKADGAIDFRVVQVGGDFCSNGSMAIALTVKGFAAAVDCDRDGMLDSCEPDCDRSGEPDDCELAAHDCDQDGVLDTCAIASGAAVDGNGDGIPDLCQADCNGNGLPDAGEIAAGGGTDCDGNGVLDACEVRPGDDCDGDGIPDGCAIALGVAPDCDANGRPDGCDLADGAADLDGNAVPDACDPDCDGDGLIDVIEIEIGLAGDLDGDGVPDECEGLGDLDGDGVVDGNDLGLLLSSTGPCPAPAPGACPADFDGDGFVGAADLGILLARWGG